MECGLPLQIKLKNWTLETVGGSSDTKINGMLQAPGWVSVVGPRLLAPVQNDALYLTQLVGVTKGAGALVW